MSFPSIKKSPPLSRWPGAAGLQALHDVRRIDALEGIGLDMRFWRNDEECTVCAAGATLICREGEEWNGDEPRSLRVQAMDYLRRGMYHSYLTSYGLRPQLAYEIWGVIVNDDAYLPYIRSVKNDAGNVRTPEWYKGLNIACRIMDRELKKWGWTPEGEV